MLQLEVVKYLRKYCKLTDSDTEKNTVVSKFDGITLIVQMVKDPEVLTTTTRRSKD